MKLQIFFKNVFSYAAGMETWVDNYFKSVGYKKKYTFVSDFAIADWHSEADVREWKSDYKAFTEVVMTLNMLSWAHDQLAKQGIDDRTDFIALYSDLYYKSQELFYETYKGNTEACDYFFETTD